MLGERLEETAQIVEAHERPYVKRVDLFAPLQGLDISLSYHLYTPA